METAEWEAIINFNDAEDTINIFTCHKRIMTKMGKLGAVVKDRCVLNGKIHHVEYEIPKNRVNITISLKRRISDGQKQRMRERINTNIKTHQKANKFNDSYRHSGAIKPINGSK